MGGNGKVNLNIDHKNFILINFCFALLISNCLIFLMNPSKNPVHKSQKETFHKKNITEFFSLQSNLLNFKKT